MCGIFLERSLLENLSNKGSFLVGADVAFVAANLDAHGGERFKSWSEVSHDIMKTGNRRGSDAESKLA